MSYYTFDFPFHKVRKIYPSNSTVVQFGRGYSYASAPLGPPQVTYHLSFLADAMLRWVDPNGVLDSAFDRKKNFEALAAFWLVHQLYQPFYYARPGIQEQQTLFRFAKPFEEPDPSGPGKWQRLSNGYMGHFVEAFTIDLIQQPT